MKKVTLQTVENAVARIEKMSGDAEGAHAAEDELHQAVLYKIARQAPSPWCELAAAALRTNAIDFSRWYA